MVERFNQTLLNMLGNLRDDQKQAWKTYVAPLVYSYNATRHDSTGYSPFFLMFGRHPRLAVDACLGIQITAEPVSSRAHYSSKLKNRLNFAYKVAAREAEKSADRNKAHYDLKVREDTLDVGDKVLIRTTQESLPKLRKPVQKRQNVQLNCRILTPIPIPMNQLFQDTLFRQGVIMLVI